MKKKLCIHLSKAERCSCCYDLEMIHDSGQGEIKCDGQDGPMADEVSNCRRRVLEVSGKGVLQIPTYSALATKHWAK